ncbi:DsrE family protein [Halarcobacter ebronensis]|uniref:DsrE family protein n=1 Tax=Halarcobacter ebronensis TaxID=1462615 RepID=A0A4Q1ARV2_9BACT|nr:DsrE family protein [Halarcobacter ebronensis]QKF82780.1 DsrE/DsrF-like family protein [Halarcobacter ebronensis]RXK06804.1 DsrE family protein [Halarcobacter ebronensis]
MKENLLIVWSNGDKEVANKFPLLYSSVLLERNYWNSCHLMLWGPSILLVKKSKKIRKKLIEIQKTGVTMSACIVCVEDYKAVKKLENLNINIEHTGELLTKALKDESWAVMTI